MILTNAQRQAVEEGGDVAVMIDGIECVVVRADVFESMTHPRANGDAGNELGRGIEEELAEIAAEVPDAEWANLPDDLTDHLDHHLYGTPKASAF